MFAVILDAISGWDYHKVTVTGGGGPSGIVQYSYAGGGRIPEVLYGEGKLGSDVFETETGAWSAATLRQERLIRDLRDRLKAAEENLEMLEWNYQNSSKGQAA